MIGSHHKITPIRTLSAEQLLAQIADNTDIEVHLKSITPVFRNRTVLVGTTPTLIIAKAQFDRGYILLNPNAPSLVPQVQTIFSGVGAPFPAPPGTYLSAIIPVVGFTEASCYLNITANAAALALTINMQSEDPLTGVFAQPASDTDIFTGANAVTPPSFYARLTEGFVTNVRFQAIVGAGAGTITFSLSAALSALAASTAGVPIFIGSSRAVDFNSFPLLPATEKPIYLYQNTEIWGIAEFPVNISIFELQ